MGMGHVQQSTTVARELRTAADVSFLTKSSETTAAAIRESGFDATRLQNDTEILQHLCAMNPDVIVFDKIDVDEQLARSIKQQLNAGLVIFTNLTRANLHADVAVTADIGSRFRNVSYTDPETRTHYYYGPRYWVLRPEFHQHKRQRSDSPDKVESVLLIFGGSDPLNLTSAALDALLSLDQDFRIATIVGAHFSHDEDLLRVLGRHGAKAASVTLHRNIKNVAELMGQADLVVASPGLSVFEALRVGTPVIVMPQDDLQRDTYKGFIRMVERDQVSKLAGMIERREFTYPDEDHIVQMEIGEGVQELVGAILGSARKAMP